MTVIERIVDNRTFLLGLDHLYREAIKPHERNELLDCAKKVAATLAVAPANVPIEGYYAEDGQLTEYFRLMKGLSKLGASRAAEVGELADFKRLKAVKSSSLFGAWEKSKSDTRLLPSKLESLSMALWSTRPDWNMESITRAAHSIATASDDFSLAGLASMAQDTVVLCSLGESVVLYAEYFDIPSFLRGERPAPPTYDYIWSVDDELSRRAAKFIETFNALFDERLPLPRESKAENYWHASQSNDIVGRCVNLGHNPDLEQLQHYHWAIFQNEDGVAEVQEFWSPRIWTTSDYQSLKPDRGPLSESLTRLTDGELPARR